MASGKGRKKAKVARKHREHAARSAARRAQVAPRPSGGGRGDDPPLTAVQENKIISLMVHRPRQVWPLTEDDFRDGVATTRRNMQSADGRVSNVAVKNLVAMEAQNMGQERQDRVAPEPPPGSVTNNTQINLSLLTDEQLNSLLGVIARLEGGSLAGGVPAQPALLPQPLPAV